MSQHLRFSPPSYTDLETSAVSDCIKRGWTGTGPKTAEFEKAFAEYKSSSAAIGVSSCTASLFLSLKALKILISFQIKVYNQDPMLLTGFAKKAFQI